MKEIWKDVVGYEGYYIVSNCGNIMSLDRDGFNGKSMFTIPGKRLKFKKSKFGYLSIGLTNSDGVRRYKMVHRIVIEAFVGKSTLQVNHKDLNKTNNHISNLEYISPRNNINHYHSQANHASSLPGASWKKSSNKWQGQITINGKKKYLGLFDTAEEANASYVSALINTNNG